MGLFNRKSSEESEEEYDSDIPIVQLEDDEDDEDAQQRPSIFSKLLGGPELASNERADDEEEDYVPEFGVDDPASKIAGAEESWISIVVTWFRNIIGFTVILGIVVAILYSGLSAFLMVYSPLKSGDTERSWVMRGTLGSSIVPAGTEDIVVSRSNLAPHSADGFQNVFNWITIGWGGIANPAVVKVLSSPGDSIHMSSKGIITLYDLDGKEITSGPYVSFDPSSPPEEQTSKLANEYLVECVSGDCESGSIFVVDSRQIFGERR